MTGRADAQSTFAADIRLSVRGVLIRARDYFGPNGPCHLTITEEGPHRLVFAGHGGYVIVNARRAPGGSHVELEVWGFEDEARTFVETASGDDG